MKANPVVAIEAPAPRSGSPADVVGTGRSALLTDHPQAFAVGVLAVQLVLMLVFSTVEYHRYSLSMDFALYSQAWWSIAHGHLDPYSTVLGMPFWRNDTELVMWPLALLHALDPQPVILLWVQDLALVLTELVTLRWVAAVLDRSGLPPRRTALVATLSAVVLVLDPWAWETIAFDFHPHILAALFTVLVGYDLWSGRRRAWLWVLPALVCCAPAGLYVAGAGAAGAVSLPGRRARGRSLAVAGCGVAWLLSVSALGGAGLGGTGVSHWYGYLIGPHAGHVGALAIGLGILRHPGTVLHLLAGRCLIALGFLSVVGLIGIFSAWGACLLVAVFGPAMLNADPAFFRPAQSFQAWPALPFVLVGTVLVVTRLHPPNPTLRRLLVGLGAALASLTLTLSVVVLLGLPSTWIAVSPAGARTLARVERSMPRSAEVIVDNGIAGRFGERADVRVVYRRPVKLDRPLVVIVLASGQGVSDPTASQERAAIASLRRQGAVLTVDRAGISVLTWRPPATERTLVLPS